MSDTFRVLVTGTRENGELIRHMVEGHLERLIHSHAMPTGRRLVVVHGRCPRGGVDLYADRWAREWGHGVEPHPADWEKHGKRAGPIRNTAMVETRPDYCLGFPAPGSRGTWDCLQKAVDVGIPTEVFVVAPDPPGSLL